MNGGTSLHVPGANVTHRNQYKGTSLKWPSVNQDKVENISINLHKGEILSTQSTKLRVNTHCDFCAHRSLPPHRPPTAVMRLCFCVQLTIFTAQPKRSLWSAGPVGLGQGRQSTGYQRVEEHLQLWSPFRILRNVLAL